MDLRAFKTMVINVIWKLG